MCGILGLLNLDGAPAEVASVAPLVPLLAHRGPDDSGTAALGPACFGHTRLSILGVDAPAARQPVREAGRLLAFNGEIYNFGALAERLRGQGVAVVGDSDTEVLFRCLEHWGIEETLARADAMAAFAWYDERTRKLWLARDPLGEKFLYWAIAGRRLWFASEIKVLVEAGAASREPNRARLDDFFHTGKVNGAETLFRDVREVEPGGTVEIAVGEAAPRTRSYWSLARRALAGPASAPAAFAESFADAVSSRRIADVPIAVLLSGGIDSCALTEALLAADHTNALDLFFADNADAEMSERADAETFVAGARLRHPAATLRFHPNLIGFDDYQRRFRRLTWHYDEPIQFANSPLLDGLCEIARDHGIKVLLSGEGADELLHGYERFARTGRELAGVTARDEIVAALYYGGGRHAVADVARLAGGEGAEATAPWHWLETHAGDFPLWRLQLLFSQRYRLQMLLQRQDRIGMGNGIEIRVPFLAPRFVDWANRLPLDALYDAASGRTKLALRGAMEGRLPPRILDKRKDGFPSDMLRWLRDGTLHATVAALVADPNGFSANYLDGGFAKSLVEDHFSGRKDREVLVWELFSLETWHRVCGPAAARAEVA